MAFTKKQKTFWTLIFMFFYYSENKFSSSFQSASGVQLKVPRGSIESASGLIL